MTIQEIIEKIRAEIEGRKEAILSFPENEIVTFEAKSAIRTMANGLLSFLSTLEKECEEKPTNPTIQEQPVCEDVSKEKSLSLQIQAYLNTCSDELYAEGKPLYSEYRQKEIHDCMAMWKKLHDYFFYNKPFQSVSEGLEEEAESCWRIVFPDGGIETTKMALTHDEFMMCARHFAQWGAEHLADFRKMMGDSSEITNNLNYLVDYARRQVEELLDVIKKYDDYSDEQIEELRTHLMAMFLEGTGWQKKQMMKDAVEAIISQCPGSNEIIFHNPNSVHSWEFPWKFSAKGLNKGDKVRIIIVKED